MSIAIAKTVRKPEFWFMLATLIIVLAVGFISDLLKLGWKSGWVLAVGMYFIILIFAFITSDDFLKKLLVFGLTAGIVELLADAWLVQSTGTLIYAHGEPMIAFSPQYMPFAWAVILTQVGYLGWLIGGIEKVSVTIIITAILGFAVIPLFEFWAKGAGWWYYKDTPMFLNTTPYFIAAGEALLCAILPVFFKIIIKKGVLIAVLFGILEGLWIWGSYFLFYRIFQPL